MRSLLWAMLSGAAVFVATNAVVGAMTLGFTSWWYTLCGFLAGAVSAIIMTCLDRSSWLKLAFAVTTAPFVLSVLTVILIAVRDDYFYWFSAIESPLLAIVEAAVGAALVVAACFRLWLPSEDDRYLARYGRQY